MAHRNHPVDRRSFLKATAIGAAGVLGAPALMAQGAAGTPAPLGTAAAPRPGYRILGRTGLEVSVVSLGAFQVKEAEVMQAALEHGANFVDTGRIYVDGRNEVLVGEAIRNFGGKVYVNTKLVGCKPKEEMEKSVDDSLAALRLDYVDVLMLHKLKDVKEVYDGPSREVILKAREQGKTRFLGVSTHENEAAIINAVVDDPDKIFDCILVSYSYKALPEVKQAIERAAKAGIGIIAMKTQMGGYATQEFGDITPQQAALKWVLNNENIACAIPSMVNLNQIKEDMAVMKMYEAGAVALTPRESASLQKYSEEIASRWCYRCGECTGTCPNGADIPVVNRCLMYAEGYGDVQLARWTRSLEMKDFPCADCSECVARCARGLDLPAQITRARQVLA